jgi:hypothetical protein
MYVSINKHPRSPELLRLCHGRVQRRIMGSDVVAREGRLRTRVVMCQQLSQVLFCSGQTRFVGIWFSVFSKYRLRLPLARLFRSGRSCRFDTLIRYGSVLNVRGSVISYGVLIWCVQTLSAEPHLVRIWKRQQQCPEEWYEWTCDKHNLHMQKTVTITHT